MLETTAAHDLHWHVAVLYGQWRAVDVVGSWARDRQSTVLTKRTGLIVLILAQPLFLSITPQVVQPATVYTIAMAVVLESVTVVFTHTRMHTCVSGSCLNVRQGVVRSQYARR